MWCVNGNEFSSDRFLANIPYVIYVQINIHPLNQNHYLVKDTTMLNKQDCYTTEQQQCNKIMLHDCHRTICRPMYCVAIAWECNLEPHHKASQECQIMLHTPTPHTHPAGRYNVALHIKHLHHCSHHRLWLHHNNMNNCMYVAHTLYKAGAETYNNMCITKCCITPVHKNVKNVAHI